MNKMLKILIVDDNPRFIQALKSTIEEVLSTIQIRIDAAYTGEEGLAQVKKENYDFIFMDINMPGIGGISAIKQVDRDYYRTKTKIIAVSFHNEIEFVQQVLSAGARKYFVKDELDYQTLEELFKPELSRNYH